MRFVVLALLALAMTSCAAVPRAPKGPIPSGGVHQTLYDTYGYSLPSPENEHGTRIPWGTPVEVSAVFCSGDVTERIADDPTRDDGRVRYLPEPSAPRERGPQSCSPISLESAFMLPSAGGTEMSFANGRRVLDCYQTHEVTAEPELLDALAKGTLTTWSQAHPGDVPRVLLIKTGATYTEQRECGPHELDCFMGPQSWTSTWATLAVHVFSGGTHAPLARLPMREDVRLGFYTIAGDDDFDNAAWLDPTPEGVKRLRALVDATALDPERQHVALVDLAVTSLLAGDDATFMDAMARAHALPQAATASDPAVESMVHVLLRHENARKYSVPFPLRDPCRPDARVEWRPH